MSPAERGRVLLVVNDGLGFDPLTVIDLSRRIIGELGSEARRTLLNLGRDVVPGSYQMLDIVRMAVMPIAAEGVNPQLKWSEALEVLDNVDEIRSGLVELGHGDEIESVRKRIATEHRYIPWIAEDARWSAIVNRNLTVPTHASGVWVGYEDVDPPVQGNSETGHQQIGNLALAPQIPLQISQSISDGSFFDNAKLRTTIEETLKSGGKINFCFLLSGIQGSDGRVHSAWNHLVAFLELVFDRIGAPPEKVKMQAILDGRDAPARGSMTMDFVDDGYLGELERLLQRYDAVESLAWVIGRSLSMDRDYREENARCDYLLMTQSEGIEASGFDDVRKLVRETHDTGSTDADVPAISLNHNGNGAAKVEPGDAFINLNFRSDRQRSKTALLAGAREYLEREAGSRGRTWGFDWLRDDLDLRICTMAEYDAEFEDRYGVSVAFQITPHRLNLLANWDRIMPPDDRYLLVAESVKALHMGYFVRGRREAEQSSRLEDRIVVPSDGVSEGVQSDSDFYLNPAMKVREVAGLVSDAMIEGEHRLIACNLAAPDMVGHLLPLRFHAAIEAYRDTVATLVELSDTARKNGYSMVVTSDHGNIENDAPTHTTNPVLTTVIPSRGEVLPHTDNTNYSATLYDISHTIARLLGIESSSISDIVEVFRGSLADEFVGKSIIA